MSGRWVAPRRVCSGGRYRPPATAWGAVTSPPVTARSPSCRRVGTRASSTDGRTDRRRNRRRRTTQPRQVYERRYVQTIRAVDLWSVLKVAICFYFAALIVLLVSGMMLWWIASASGLIGNIEKF